jgi:hypothetical protein
VSDDLFQRLRRAYCSKDDPVPPGFKSRAQLQAEWGCSRAYAKDLLNAGVRDGLLEVVTCKIGKAVTPFYKPVGNKRSTPRPKRR